MAHRHVFSHKAFRPEGEDGGTSGRGTQSFGSALGHIFRVDDVAGEVKGWTKDQAAGVQSAVAPVLGTVTSLLSSGIGGAARGSQEGSQEDEGRGGGGRRPGDKTKPVDVVNKLCV